MAKKEYKCNYCGYKTVNLYGSYLCPVCRHVLQPAHPQKKIKPLRQRWWIWIIVIIIACAIGWRYKDAIISRFQNIPQIIESAGINQGANNTTKPDNVVDATPFSNEDCIEIDYKTYERYPEKYKNTAVKATVVVMQRFEKNKMTYYACYAYDEGNPLKIDANKLFVVYDFRKDDTERILVDDVIKVYGTFEGIQTANLVMLTEKKEVEALMIKMKDSVLITDGD